ncbi:MAG: class I SAM-dependent methyltransferase [Rhodospirillaceae bacterium]
MPTRLSHDLAIDSTRDETARQGFATGMRQYVLGNLAGHMRTVYDRRVQPSFEKKNGRGPKDGPEIHKAIKPDSIFKFYSAVRNGTQELVWRSVLPGIARASAQLAEKAAEQNADDATLHLDSTLEVPRYISELDVHLMPGCYHTERFDGDVAQGALYDNGLSVFLMGYLGPEMDDTGRSVAQFIKARYPDFAPETMIDIGATIGFNTLPWLEAWPDLEVHAIDPAAPNVRYGHARCKAMGQPIHFHQMNGTDLKFEDNSIDIVWSAMVLHELPPADVAKVLVESYRVLKPGGLMIHMELPLNADMEPYDQFYMDWDAYYNKEPFYKSLRDTDVQKAVTDAGFDEGNFVRFVIPSQHGFGADAIKYAAAASADAVEGNVGKLQGGLKWFTFGGWK